MDTKNQILFQETQRFKQWWVILLLGCINILFIYSCVQQVAFGNIIGNNPMSDLALIITTFAFVVFTFLFFSLKLDTEIREDGIYVRFFPFRIKLKKHNWDDMTKTYVRQYKPIMEFGGWGIRGFKSNRALSVSGKEGLQLEFKDKNRLLIGSKQCQKIEEVIRKINRYKE